MKENILDLKTKIKIKGHVRIENGDTIIEADNKSVDRLAWGIITYLAANTTIASANSGWISLPNGAFDYNAGNQYMYLGNDTTTQTTHTATSLSSPIGEPTKCANIYPGAWTDAANSRTVGWTGIFPAGTVSGTCGEMGLYFILPSSLAVAGAGLSQEGSKGLASRLSVADGEFEAFTIDTTKPLVITWTLSFTTDGVFTQWMLNTISNLFMMGSINNGGMTKSLYLPSISWIYKTTYLVLGTDQTTGNTLGMSNLVSPIGTNPGTKPSTQVHSTTSLDNGKYQVTWVGTWGANTISGTCGEIGIYLCNPYYATQQTAIFQGAYENATVFFAGRLCHADDHFTAFEIDTDVATTISWTLEYEWG